MPQLAQVVTVEQHAALLGVVQTSEEAGDGALARAGGADERERLARRDVQVEPVEHEAVALVAEADAVEPDVALRVELDRMARLAQLRLGLEHLRDPAARGERLLQRRHALAEHAQRPDEHHHVSVEGDERADGEIAVDHAAAADPEHGGDPEQRQHLEHRDEDRVEPREREGAVHDLDAAAAEARGQRVAGAEPLDDADPADGLLDERRRLGPAGLQLAGALVVLARVEPRADGHERHRDQHHQREPPVEDQHHDRNRDHGQRRSRSCARSRPSSARCAASPTRRGSAARPGRRGRGRSRRAAARARRARRGRLRPSTSGCGSRTGGGRRRRRPRAARLRAARITRRAARGGRAGRSRGRSRT